jgi:hypothetical protein
MGEDALVSNVHEIMRVNLKFTAHRQHNMISSEVTSGLLLMLHKAASRTFPEQYPRGAADIRANMRMASTQRNQFLYNARPVQQAALNLLHMLQLSHASNMHTDQPQRVSAEQSSAVSNRVCHQANGKIKVNGQPQLSLPIQTHPDPSSCS